MNSPAIEIQGLIKRHAAFTLGPLDLTVPRGAIYGLIGPNGAGKTTIIDMIFGMGKNDAGQIRVLGLDHRTDAVALKRRAAYVSPDLNFQVWGRVGKAIRFVRGFFPDWDDAYCAALMTALKAAVATLQPGMTGAQVTNALTLPGFENNPTMQVLLQVVKGKIEASRTGKAASADICGTALTFVGGVLTSVKTP